MEILPQAAGDHSETALEGTAETLAQKSDTTLDCARKAATITGVLHEDDKPSDDEGKISGWSTITSAQAKRLPEDDLRGSTEQEADVVAAAGGGSEEHAQQQTHGHKRKKSSSSSPSNEFIIPPNLKPDEKDSRGEANRKKRAIKAMKNQWRTQRKEHDANKKQKSWQDFQKRGKAGSTSSIFSTSTDTNAKVGVVGERNLTNFASRKRHK